MLRRSMFGLLLLPGCGKSPTSEKKKDGAEPAFDEAFWKAWPEGKAEILRYDWNGTPVEATFVKEMLSNSLRVRSVPGKRKSSDEFPAMRLNLRWAEDSVTAIVALAALNDRAAGSPSKIVWSRRETEGVLYRACHFDKGAVRVISHSFRDGEADQQQREETKDAVLAGEDALLLWARGLAWPVLKQGETREVRAVLALQKGGTNDGPLRLGQLKLARPQGGVYTAASSDGCSWRFEVDPGPRRVVTRIEITENGQKTTARLVS